MVNSLRLPDGHPCPGQLGFPFRFVVTADLVVGDEECLRFNAAVIPAWLHAGRQNP